MADWRKTDNAVGVGNGTYGPAIAPNNGLMGQISSRDSFDLGHGFAVRVLIIDKVSGACAC